MERWPRHLHRHDLRFLAFVLANLFCVAGFIASSVTTEAEHTGGWRRIDIDAITARIEAGDLVGKEASWYHPYRGELRRDLSPTIDPRQVGGDDARRGMRAVP